MKKPRTLDELTPAERATYDKWKVRLLRANLNMADGGETPAYLRALEGEFENWAEQIGLSQEEL